MGYNPIPFIVASTSCSRTRHTTVPKPVTSPSYCKEYGFYYSSYEEFSEKYRKAKKVKEGDY